jgi:hypothetical protein
VWDQGAFIPPLIPLETAAGLITGKRNKGEAMAALEEFLRSYAPWMLLEEVRERGGLGAEFCAQMKEDYREARRASVREKRRQIGKKTKNLKRATKIA